MPTDNRLAADIETVGTRARYDAGMKNLLAYKPVLAWIVKYSCKEMGNYSIEEITSFIEGDPAVGSVPVMPGETNATMKIRGMNTEKAVHGEGKVTFDILFSLCIPGESPKQFFINIEAQNNYHPGYALESRGVFYCAREISSQMGRDFEDPHYDRISKVYSIWICPNSPITEGNTITSFAMKQNNIYGEHKASEHCDLLEVVLIGLVDRAEETTDLHRILNTILSSDMDTGEKKKILGEYDIPVTQKLEEEMGHMCNLSEGILNKGRAEGLAEGRVEGIAEGEMRIILKLVKKDLLSVKDGAEQLGISEADLMEKLDTQPDISNVTVF